MRTMKITRPEAVTPSMRMGATTQQFFIEGAEHEATHWEHAQLPPDDVVDAEPALEFTSFDKIPHKRGPLLSVVAIAVFLVIGSVAWAMSLNRLGGGRAVKDWVASTLTSRGHLLARISQNKPAASSSSRTDMPVVPLVPVSAPMPPAPSAVVAAPQAEAPAAVVPPPAAIVPPSGATARVDKPAPVAVVAAPVTAPEPTIVPIPAVREPAVAPPSSARAKLGDNEAAVRRSHALKGFVWSPEAGRLVPAHPSAEESASPSSAE